MITSFAACKKVVRFMSGIIFAVSFLSLVGWMTGQRRLASWGGSYIPVAENTALLFVTFSAALFFSTLRPKPKVLRPLTALVMLATIVYCGRVLHSSADIRTIMQTVLTRGEIIYPSASAGKMSSLTAMAFIVSSSGFLFSIFFLNKRSLRIFPDVFAIGVFLFGGFSAIGYLNGMPILYGGSVTPMALPTALMFMLLAISMVAQNGESSPLLCVILEQSVRAHLIRVFVPIIALFLLAQGLLDIKLETYLTTVNPTVIHIILMLIVVFAATLVIIVISGRVSQGYDAAQKALRESEAKYRVLLESIPMNIFAKGKDLRYLSCNGKYAEYLGIDPRQIAGKDDFMFHSREMAEKYRADDIRVLAAGAPETIEEKYHLKGEERWALTIKAPIKLSDGEIYGVLGISYDITDRKKAVFALVEAVALKAAVDTAKAKAAEIEAAYKELERTQGMLIQAEKMSALGEMSAGVAHELNSPLAGILGIARFHAKNEKIDGSMRDDFKDITQASERMAAIVKGLVDYSRPSVNEMEELHCNDIIETLLSFTQKAMAGDKVNIQKNYEKDMPPIRGDKNQLQQVIINLIDNAFYAMQDEGVLKISTRSVILDGNRFAEIEFTDSGCGIKEEDLPRIFEPFFTTKRPGKGTGLGLAVAHSIINRHGGEIEVESPLPGQEKGSSFKIRIPAITGAI